MIAPVFNFLKGVGVVLNSPYFHAANAGMSGASLYHFTQDSITPKEESFGDKVSSDIYNTKNFISSNPNHPIVTAGIGIGLGAGALALKNKFNKNKQSNEYQ